MEMPDLCRDGYSSLQVAQPVTRSIDLDFSLASSRLARNHKCAARAAVSAPAPTFPSANDRNVEGYQPSPNGREGALVL